MKSVNFSVESIDQVVVEIAPLLEKHWEEIAHYKDIPLDPDFDRYYQLAYARLLHIYTARLEPEGNNKGKLIGYGIYIVQNNMHYKSSLQAVQDILFVDPKYRGFGRKFILWCDEKLKEQGVQAVYHHIKAEHNWGKMIEGLGYELVDLIYARRLDNGGSSSDSSSSGSRSRSSDIEQPEQESKKAS